MTQTCKGWNLIIGRMQLDLNIHEYSYDTRFYTDYNQAMALKHELETNKKEQEIHKTTASIEVVWWYNSKRLLELNT